MRLSAGCVMKENHEKITVEFKCQRELPCSEYDRNVYHRAPLLLSILLASSTKTLLVRCTLLAVFLEQASNERTSTERMSTE